MNAKFRDVGRVNLRPSARERDPVKLIQKKIAFLAGGDKSNPEVTKKFEREVRTSVREIKKMAFKRYRQKSARLFAKAGQLTAGLELALGARQMRDHAAARQNRLLYLKPDYQNERRKNMNGITILLAVVFALLIGFLSVQGVRAILYSQSDEWKLQQRLRRFVRREAE